MTKSTPTRTSFAHGQYDLPGDAFADKLREARIKRLFEAQSEPDKAIQRADMRMSEAKRRDEAGHSNTSPPRGSGMVRNHKPQPVPRPSPSWARGPDKAAFYARWRNEKRQAQLIQATKARDGLIQNHKDLDHIESALPSAKPVDQREAERTLFKLQRRFEGVKTQAKEHSQTRKRIERDL